MQNRPMNKIKKIIFRPKVLFIAICAELFSIATYEKIFSEAKLVKTMATDEIANKYIYLPNSISEAKFAKSTKVE